MEKKYIISLDQGTTSSRAIIFDKDLNIASMSQREYTQLYPKSGWVEHDPMEIYSSQYSVLAEALAKSEINAEEIAAIGITNQRETTIVWDKNTGKPVYNAIVWQCRRTADICKDLEERGFAEYIKESTGLLIDAYFSGTKISWILDNVEGAREQAENGELLFGTVDSWLIWKLTDGKVHVTDYTNASRTMIFNINTLQWDEKILQALNIPKCMLPEVRNSSEVYAEISLPISNDVKVPISGIAGDQQASLFGQLCFNKGDVKNTYGTGCFLLMNTGEELVQSKHGLITTIAIGIDGKVQYALEGSVFVAGAVIQWLRSELGLISESEDSEYFAKKVDDSAGVYVVPAFTGLGAPHWDMYARGTILGVTRGTNKNHIIRAAIESIAYQSNDIIQVMIEDSGIDIANLKVDGGATENALLMQFQADITGVNIKKPVIKEITALGAAYLAGLAVGVWKDKEELLENFVMEHEYSPSMDKEKVNKLVRTWRKAVERSKGWDE